MSIPIFALIYHGADYFLSATPVPFGRGRGKPIAVPDHPPPPGYLCYRCREKGTYWSVHTRGLIFLTRPYAGHWIQACPTNNDPKFDGKYRVKRSTGIPRSLQTKVEKPDPLPLDSEDLRNTGVMVNADGDFVIAKPDKATWELYQEKAKASAAAAAEAAAAQQSKELQERGLECPIDKRMFLEPTKTPCCHRTYCNDCITNALIESDFVCPGCGTEGVLLDNLSVDEVAVSKIKEYEAEKAEAKKEKEKYQSQDRQSPTTAGDSTSADNKTNKSLNDNAQPAQAAAKKRPAEDDRAGVESPGANPSSLAKKRKPNSPATIEGMPPPPPSSLPMMPFNQPIPFPMMQPSAVPFANPGAFMNPMMFAAATAANGFPNAMDPVWAPQMNSASFDPQQDDMYGGNGDRSNPYQTMDMYGGDGMGEFPMNSMYPNGQGSRPRHFSNQQRTYFSTPYNREEETAYFRQPVNPQRHQARHRRIRPSDYREL